MKDKHGIMEFSYKKDLDALTKAHSQRVERLHLNYVEDVKLQIHSLFPITNCMVRYSEDLSYIDWNHVELGDKSVFRINIYNKDFNIVTEVLALSEYGMLNEVPNQTMRYPCEDAESIVCTLKVIKKQMEQKGFLPVEGV